MLIDVILNYINEMKLKTIQNLQWPEAPDMEQPQKCVAFKHVSYN